MYCTKRGLLPPVPRNGNQIQGRDGDRGGSLLLAAGGQAQPRRLLSAPIPVSCFALGRGPGLKEHLLLFILPPYLNGPHPHHCSLEYPSSPLGYSGTSPCPCKDPGGRRGGEEERTSWRLSVPGHSTLPQARLDTQVNGKRGKAKDSPSGRLLGATLALREM